ncbi:MAG TPA: DUF4153 domain-containing protein [Asanoa sp.]
MRRTSTPRGLAAPARRRSRSIESAVPVVLLDLQFLAFVAVQVRILFGVRAYSLGPNGPTFAEQGRGGFSQPLAVTALILLIAAAAGR